MKGKQLARDTCHEDFTMVDKPRMANLPMRPRSPQPGDRANVEIHPIRSCDDFIVSIQPPVVPERGIKRASCDIVLVIDVSASMRSPAPLPDVEDPNEKEAGGLSVLDLTKHAARTILETLNAGDRLGIVTFAEDATVVQELTFITCTEKKATWQRIQHLQTQYYTNMWAGIRTGLRLFTKTPLVGNIQSLYVLTDGMPNHMCPKQGYVAKLRPMFQSIKREQSCTPSIHTFGFGYDIRSELLQSIAEVGGGTYAFIPDVGMIGTAFVHAVSNLFSTLGTSATLELELSDDTPLKATAGLTLTTGSRGKLLDLGTIQYGQSRDLVFICPGIRPDTVITATINYKLPSGDAVSYQSRALFSEKTNLSPDAATYHQYRAEICSVLSSLFPLKDNGEHRSTTDEAMLAQARNQVNMLAKSIRASPFKDMQSVGALLQELVGEEPSGQISKALTTSGNGRRPSYWSKWGRHYLPSLLHAHQRQVCNTFKDPGVLIYGSNSPLFISCRTQLDEAFDNLPAPKPSLPPKVIYQYDQRGNVTDSKTAPHRSVHMRSYNSSATPCFAGTSKVTMADGSHVPIKDLRTGMLVWTPMGARRVAAVLKTPVRSASQQLCRLGELLVTPWHPVKHEGEWIFPQHIAQSSVVSLGSVYSVMLAPFRYAESHAIEVGGRVCVTLGHGVVRQKGDVRSHSFLGNYWRVAKSLARLPVDSRGHLRCAGLRRDPRTGLACAFMSPVVVKRAVSKMVGLSGRAARHA